MVFLGSRTPHYQLVLDGWGLEATIHLTRKTTNRKVIPNAAQQVEISFSINSVNVFLLVQKLRHLAHELTANLQVNYFDSHNSSKHRILSIICKYNYILG